MTLTLANVCTANQTPICCRDRSYCFCVTYRFVCVLSSPKIHHWNDTGGGGSGKSGKSGTWKGGGGIVRGIKTIKLMVWSHHQTHDWLFFLFLSRSTDLINIERWESFCFHHGQFVSPGPSCLCFLGTRFRFPGARYCTEGLVTIAFFVTGRHTSRNPFILTRTLRSKHHCLSRDLSLHQTRHLHPHVQAEIKSLTRSDQNLQTTSTLTKSLVRPPLSSSVRKNWHNFKNSQFNFDLFRSHTVNAGSTSEVPVMT